MDWSPDDLGSVTRKIQKLSLEAIYSAGSGHPGGCLSVASILAALYFKIMRPQPGYLPSTPNSDVLILSKGHSVPAVYSCLYLLGVISESELLQLRKLGARTQGHPSRSWLPAVTTSTGSLGQGCAFSVGLAMAFKRQGNSRQVYAVLGDGDLQEGITTESARLAAHYRLSNLTWICDRNKMTSDQFSIDPVQNALKEFNAYGWWAEGVDGHNTGEMVSLLEFTRQKATRPVFVEARTIKGRGVSFMESDPAGYHGSMTLSREELDKALGELNVS